MPRAGRSGIARNVLQIPVAQIGKVEQVGHAGHPVPGVQTDEEHWIKANSGAVGERFLDAIDRRAGDLAPSWDDAAMAGANDPGVRSVRAIFDRLKGGGYRTEVMGASFRNVGQILALAGCDLLTISPELLDELASSEGDVPRVLDASAALATPRVALHEAVFRWRLNEDAMATEKLAEGIRAFAADAAKLEQILRGLD